LVYASGRRNIVVKAHNQVASALKRIMLLLFALFLGATIIVVFSLIHGLITGDSLSPSGGIVSLTIKTIVVAFPLLILAMIGITAKTPWLTGIALIVAAWGFVLYETVERPSNGANIGLGLLLVASPFVITIICLIVARGSERARQP
jgi:hypothetical protein